MQIMSCRDRVVAITAKTTALGASSDRWGCSGCWQLELDVTRVRHSARLCEQSCWEAAHAVNLRVHAVHVGSASSMKHYLHPGDQE